MIQDLTTTFMEIASKIECGTIYLFMVFKPFDKVLWLPNKIVLPRITNPMPISNISLTFCI
jgi:hypothetical protein